jgi:predicted RNase H-like nuclease
MTPVFLGIDLGWQERPTGVAAIDGKRQLLEVARLEKHKDVLDWVQSHEGDAVAAVDAPLVIPNASGTREAEKQLNKDFRRFHAGCHAANQGRPFAAKVTAFSAALLKLGYRHQPTAGPKPQGRYQIEVHPHAATITLFDLPRIVKYKKGPRAARFIELTRYRALLSSLAPRLPEIPAKGNLKPVEDQLDAIFCAFIAHRWWNTGPAGNYIFGDDNQGAIVVPKPATYSSKTATASFPY